MCKLMSIESFAEKHNVNTSTVYAGKSNGVYNGYAFQTRQKEHDLINESFFVRRYKFKRKVWLESHDLFYFLTRHMKAVQLSELLHKMDKNHSPESWNHFQSKTLFAFQSESILNYRVDGMSMKFYRYARWLVRGLFILKRVKPEHRDLKVLLDKY